MVGHQLPNTINTFEDIERRDSGTAGTIQDVLLAGNPPCVAGEAPDRIRQDELEPLLVREQHRPRCTDLRPTVQGAPPRMRAYDTILVAPCVAHRIDVSPFERVVERLVRVQEGLQECGVLVHHFYDGTPCLIT
jgi:hypothetical protein